MHPSSQKAVIDAIQRMTCDRNITGTVRVKVSPSSARIDIDFDNRKYIGRLRLQLQGDKYIVYMMDKDEGKIMSSAAASTKSAYLEIKNAADARLFVKW